MRMLSMMNSLEKHQQPSASAGDGNTLARGTWVGVHSTDRTQQCLWELMLTSQILHKNLGD